ncbi:hypothetical protein PHYSODRAFT_517553, partial [Phytophthora sojae]
LLPVYDDLQMRIALRLLPVRSRFWFLKQQIPDVQQCPYPNCTSIETTKHLFWECPHSTRTWQLMWEDWSIFFTSNLSWTSLILPHKLRVNKRWCSHQDAILRLWNVLRCATLHHQWTKRNYICFEDGEPDPMPTAISRIHSAFCCHYRRLLRISSPDIRKEYERVLRQLR